MEQQTELDFLAEDLVHSFDVRVGRGRVGLGQHVSDEPELVFGLQHAGIRPPPIFRRRRRRHGMFLVKLVVLVNQGPQLLVFVRLALLPVATFIPLFLVIPSPPLLYVRRRRGLFEFAHEPHKAPLPNHRRGPVFVFSPFSFIDLLGPVPKLAAGGRLALLFLVQS